MGPEKFDKEVIGGEGSEKRDCIASVPNHLTPVHDLEKSDPFKTIKQDQSKTWQVFKMATMVLQLHQTIK